MSEASSDLFSPASVAKPLQFGAELGLLVSFLARWLVAFDAMTVAVLCLVSGVVLGVWGQDWWPDVGWTLVGTGIVMLVVLPLLSSF
jgi:Na+/phosphate symporter